MATVKVTVSTPEGEAITSFWLTDEVGGIDYKGAGKMNTLYLGNLSKRARDNVNEAMVSFIRYGFKLATMRAAVRKWIAWS
jgi:hypothetical protein